MPLRLSGSSAKEKVSVEPGEVLVLEVALPPGSHRVDLGQFDRLRGIAKLGFELEIQRRLTGLPHGIEVE